MSQGLLNKDVTEIVESITKSSRELFQVSITMGLVDNDALEQNGKTLQVNAKNLDLVKANLLQYIESLEATSDNLKHRLNILNELRSAAPDPEARMAIIAQHMTIEELTAELKSLGG